MSSRNNNRNNGGSKPSFGVASAASRNGNRNSKQKKNGNGNGSVSQNQSSRNGGHPRVQQAVVSSFTSRAAMAPRFSRSSLQQQRIQNTEFIGNVTGTVAFTVASSFELNPGLPVTFPWLSTQAVGWDRYKFNRLQFHYDTATSSSVPGSVLMAPDYDAADAAPSTEQVAMDYKNREYCAPWVPDGKTANLDPNALLGGMTSKFIRTGALSANQDVKTYDSGNLHLCTTGGTAVAWGKLFVSYDVSLYDPQLPPGGAPPLGGQLLGAGTMSAANPLGTTGTFDAQTAGLSYPAAGLSVVTFLSPGSYIVNLALVGTVISGHTTPTSSSGTVTVLNSFLVNTATTISNSTYNYVTTVSNSTLTFAATATTVTAARLNIAQTPLNSQV